MRAVRRPQCTPTLQHTTAAQSKVNNTILLLLAVYKFGIYSCAKFNKPYRPSNFFEGGWGENLLLRFDSTPNVCAYFVVIS